MSVEKGGLRSAWTQRYAPHLAVGLRCLRRDRMRILALTVALGLVGVIAGYLTASVTSNAQLLLTPIPLREATTEDSLAQMIAAPMDIRTASLLCFSDEVLRKTAEALNASGALEDPVENLKTLKESLRYQITVSKETPYETVYSPILQLFAKGGHPTEAQLTVNTWAEQSVAMAEAFQQARQGDVVTAFLTQAAAIETDLAAAEEALEAFRRRNNIEVLQTRLTQRTEDLTQYVTQEATTKEALEQTQAELNALEASVAEERPVRELQWRPSGEVLGALAGPLGLPRARNGDDDEEETPGNLLVIEENNPVYDAVRQNAVSAEASLEGHRARLAAIEDLLTTIREGVSTLQGDVARVTREETRLEREMTILEEAYKDAELKVQYARMASQLKQPPLQVLSRGAEYTVPDLSRGLIFGTAGAILGLTLAVLASLLLRLLVQPAMEDSDT